jgi:hypothetical protein
VPSKVDRGKISSLLPLFLTPFPRKINIFTGLDRGEKGGKNLMLDSSTLQSYACN